MINNAIEDGLRFLYVNQCSRAAVSNTQSWYCSLADNARAISYTSLAVLGFENWLALRRARQACELGYPPACQLD